MNGQINRQDKDYMRRHPSREEVTKFVKATVKATMDTMYLPIMRSYASSSAKEVLVIVQSMLMEYGILTQEQCEDFVKKCVVEFNRKQQEEQKGGTDAETSGD